MRVGLDIDNVISDFDKGLLKAFLKEDKNKREKGIINPNARHIVHGMFDWTDEEIQEFSLINDERMSETLEVIEGAKEYIDKMLEEGNEIYLITNRVYPQYKNPVEVTKKWLKDNKINYTKLLFSETRDKSSYCKENKIDFFVDDIVRNCMILEDAGVKCYIMETKYNKGQDKIKNVVKNMKEVYEKVKENNI